MLDFIGALIRKAVTGVPYTRVSDLPGNVKSLPDKAQRMWMHSFNSTWGKNRDETQAFRSAWGAVENHYERSGEQWVAKISELPLFWSESTVDKLEVLGYTNLEQSGQSFAASGFGKDPGYLWSSMGLLDSEFKPGTIRSFPLNGRSGAFIVVGELVDTVSLDGKDNYQYGVAGLAFDKQVWNQDTIAAALDGTEFSDGFVEEGTTPPPSVDTLGIAQPTDPTVATPLPEPQPEQQLLEQSEVVSEAPPTAPEQPAEATAVAKSGNILKMDLEERTMTSIVLEPDEIDAQGDIIDADQIKLTQRRFMGKYFSGQAKIGVMHNDFKKPIQLLDSYLAPVDFTMETPRGIEKIKKGSWIATVKINDDDTWNRVKSGEYTGFSIGGSGQRSPME